MAASSQPFHQRRREHAVSDHVPRLLDAIIGILERGEPPDSTIRDAAQDHANMRVSQGLHPAEVAVEFRLLRREVGRVLALYVPRDAAPRDVIRAEFMINDALDAASEIALTSLGRLVEQLRTEFLAATVHDVRHPLTTVRAYAQITQREVRKARPELGKIEASARHIVEAADHMEAMIETLLDASRASLGDLQVSPVEVDLRSLLEEAASETLGTAASRVVVRPQGEPDTRGRWDPARLLQVFENILDNARKYSPDQSPIHVTILGDQDKVRLSVRDSGIGIPSDELGHVFDRFHRVGNAGAEQGWGLGLYLSRAIVLAHGGNIWAESEGPDSGTTVLIELPRQPPPQHPGQREGR